MKRLNQLTWSLFLFLKRSLLLFLSFVSFSNNIVMNVYSFVEYLIVK